MNGPETAYQIPKYHVPKYRRHSTRNKAFAEHLGRRRYFPGRYNSPESRAAYRDFLGQIDAAPPSLAAASQRGRDLSVAELTELYLEHCLQTMRDSSGGHTPKFHATKSWIRILLRQPSALTPASAFGPLRLKDLRARFCAYRQTLGGETAPRDKPWSRGYLNTQTKRVIEMFAWGAAHELYPGESLHPLRELPPLRRGEGANPERAPVLPVRKTHIMATLPFLSHRNATLVELQLFCGARGGELLEARPAAIERTGKVWVYRPSRHKSAHLGHRREIYLGPKSQALLAPWLLKTAGESRIFALTPHSYRQAIHRAIARANRLRPTTEQIPIWNPHQIRHAKGTSLRKKYGLDGAQVILGHARLETTQIYAERQRRLAQQIAWRSG